MIELVKARKAEAAAAAAAAEKTPEQQPTVGKNREEFGGESTVKP